MRFSKYDIWIGIFLPCVLSGILDAQIPSDVKGHNVTKVGHSRGEFVQIAPEQWEETLDGRVGHFREQSRDEWSVYLLKNNGIRVMLDLYKKQVINQDSMQALYDITSASAVAINNTAPTKIGFSNWMDANRAIIGNKPLNQLAIPGAHDAGMYEAHDTYLQPTNFKNAALVFSPDANGFKRGLSFLGPVFVRWAKTQDKNFYQQLNGGVRYFDIRVAIDGNERLVTCHGVYGAPLNDILNDIKRFLDENPNEIMILGFNAFWDLKYQQKLDAARRPEDQKGPGVDQGLRDEKWTELLDTVESTIGVSRLAVDPDIAKKTLNEVWSGPTRVICNFNRRPPTLRNWNLVGKEANTWPGSVWRMNEYKAKTFEKSLKSNFSASNKFWGINCCVTASEDYSFIPLAECKPVASNYPIGLKEIAADTNPQVLAWIRDEWKNHPINLVKADFCDDSLTKVCLARNGIPVDWSGTRVGDTKWRNWQTTDKIVAAEFEKLGKEIENAAVTAGREIEAVANDIASFFTGATGHVNPKHAPGNLWYNIRLTTGSKGGGLLNEEQAGTDSNVKIRLHGSKGTSGWFLCDNEGDDFVANKTDSYQLSSPDLGDLSGIEIQKDGYGLGPDWFLQRVEVEIGGNKMSWRAGRWISEETVSLPLSTEVIEVAKPLNSNIELLSDHSNKYLGNFYSGASYYYPIMSDSPSAGLQLVGQPAYGQEIKIKTTNTSAWKSSWTSYNLLGTFNDGVYYYDSGQGDKVVWIIESAEGKTGPVLSGHKIRLKNKSHNQYLYPYSSDLNVKTTTKATADASTVWIIRNR